MSSVLTLNGSEDTWQEEKSHLKRLAKKYPRVEKARKGSSTRRNLNRGFVFFSKIGIFLQKREREYPKLTRVNIWVITILKKVKKSYG